MKIIACVLVSLILYLSARSWLHGRMQALAAEEQRGLEHIGYGELVTRLGHEPVHSFEYNGFQGTTRLSVKRPRANFIPEWFEAVGSIPERTVDVSGRMTIIPLVPLTKIPLRVFQKTWDIHF